MAAFEPAFQALLKVEGGYSPKDNDLGAVNRGITQYFCDRVRNDHPEWPAKVADWDEPVTRACYLEYFWVRYRLEGCRSQAIATALLICLINTDPQDVIFAAQEALADVGRRVLPTDTPIYDRIIGTKTLAALNGLPDEKAWARCFIERVKAHHRELALKNPAEYGDDLEGWIKRDDGLLELFGGPHVQ